jgi:hypothetical protein
VIHIPVLVVPSAAPLSFSPILHSDILLSIQCDILYRVWYDFPVRILPYYHPFLMIVFYPLHSQAKADRLKAVVLNLAHGNKNIFIKL